MVAQNDPSTTVDHWVNWWATPASAAVGCSDDKGLIVAATEGLPSVRGPGKPVGSDSGLQL